jgi:hypothetical protein
MPSKIATKGGFMSFYDKIKDEVSNLASLVGYPNDGTAFGHFVLKECFNKIIDFEYDGNDIDGFINSHIVDSSRDLGNDAIFVNQKNNEIMIFQFKYTSSQLLNIDEIKKNKTFLDWLLKINSNNLAPNAKLKRIIDEEIHQVLTDENIKNKNFNITLYYVDNKFEGNIKIDINALYTNYKDRNINFQIKYYDYDELEQLYDDIKIPPNEVQLKVVKNEYFVKKMVYHDNTDTEIETIVTSIVANSLKPIIEEKKELILALNVRYYKGENEINSKIKKEYSKGSRSNFWILNNGINAICEDFKIEDDKLTIKNFQIVNGGQTTKTLTRIVNELSDDVQILIRLTKIMDISQVSKIAMDIAVASNSQNAIGSRDLHSGDKIQWSIFSKFDNVGIFYDKKDGEWATVSKKKYRNPMGNNPMYLKISNVEMGIAYLSFYLQLPISTKGRHKLVFSEVYYDSIFNMHINEDIQFSKLIFAYRISERVNRILSENLNNYEILQNNYVSDVLVSLAGIYFFSNSKAKISSTEKLIVELDKIEVKKYIKENDRYLLDIESNFDDFIIKLINIIQNILDVKKEAKKEYANAEWLVNETSSWLKKDGTYKEIYGKVMEKI